MKSVSLEESKRVHRKPAKGQFEGSPRDIRQDAAGAKKAGVSLKTYEGSPKDRRQDAAGQRRMTGPSRSRSK